MHKLKRGDKLVLATHNTSKLTEIYTACAPAELDLIPVSRFTPDEPVEDGGSFEANALIKARAAVAASGLVAIADDSGLAITALDGRPGVDTKPYVDALGGYEAATRALLAEVGAETTPVTFVSVLALVWPDGYEAVIEGRVNGTLALEGRGVGWGFKPWVTPDGCDRTLAELTLEENLRYNHRGQAFAKFLQFHTEGTA